MPPLTLVQKRALLAASNNLQKAHENFKKARREHIASLNRWGLPTVTSIRKLQNMAELQLKQREILYLLDRLEGKVNIGPQNNAYKTMKLNVISNVLTKHKLVPRALERRWQRGLEEEMARAKTNFKLFSNPNTRRKASPVRTPSPRRKTPSPPRARASPRNFAREANESFARWHTLGPNNTTHATWKRNAGKVTRLKKVKSL